MNLDAILGERLAILGGTGSGKSYAARGLAERILVRGERLGVIDPTGVWWGLRSDFPVVLFGGDHADLPLTEHAGRVVAQAVATSQQSWIIDTSALQTKAAERRFMLDFLDSLFGANRAPITLIVDEADRFSPQRMSPETTRLHERMEEIVRRGRVRGFTPWLITQRPASLNKDVLSQATALICMRMTGAQDRGAIGDVIEGQADKATAKAIIDAMPRHKVGEGIVWAPMQGILAPARFPHIKTFDSMSADTAHKHASRPLPAIDVDSLKEKLASVDIEAKANDPAALKARIRELEKKLAAPVDTMRPDINAELQAAHLDGMRQGFAEGVAAAAARLKVVAADVERAQHALGLAVQTATAPLPTFQRVEVPHTPRGAIPPAPAPQVTRSAPPPQRQPGGQPIEGLGKGDRLVLTVLAQYRPTPVMASKAAAIAGYSVRSSTWRNILSRLRQAGYIATGQEPFSITEAGATALGAFDPLPTGAALLEHWMARVGKGDRETLRILATLHGECPSSDLAQRAGYSPSSSTWRNILSRLRTLGLIEGSRNIKLHEDLR